MFDCIHVSPFLTVYISRCDVVWSQGSQNETALSYAEEGGHEDAAFLIKARIAEIVEKEMKKKSKRRKKTESVLSKLLD